MSPNSILALAMAFAASNPPPQHELEQVFEPAKPDEPKTQADLDRIAAAQVKRERRAKRMLEAVRNAPPNARVAELNGKPVFFSVNAEQEWLDNHRDLTADEEAEAQAACEQFYGAGHDD